MKRFNIIYYLLLLVVAMGALASMAKNSYGMIICGIACAGLAITFLVEILYVSFRTEEITKSEKPVLVFQLFILCVMAIIFSARCFSIEPFVFTPLLFLSVIVLLITFLIQGYHEVSFTKVFNRKIDLVLLTYYGAVSILLIAFSVNLFRNKWIIISASLTFGFIALFIILSFIFSRAFKTEAGRPVRDYLAGMSNKSLIVLMAGSFIFFYSFLYRINVLPDLYFGTYPSGYYKLIEAANQKDDDALLLKAQELKENYEQVARKNALK